jgi:tetratricopeptide (TPR) repeat protein
VVTELLERLRGGLPDRYEVERELGRGGAAVVFLGRDRKHGRAVALKVLLPELCAALGPARFLREIEIAARLTHPNILPIHDSGAADGLLYYVMPRVEGESLRDRLRREGPLPLVAALRIAREVADALGYAHTHGIVHRDVKPENILLEAGHAVLTDFGIARALAPSGGGLTSTGMAVGTPAYMSPEQASGEPGLDARSDVFSLGCVLYEMVTGSAPLREAAAGLAARPSGGLERGAPKGAGPLPEPLRQVLARALALAPADRFATASLFGEALEQVEAGAREARLQRWSYPMRVAMLFGGAAAALLGAVHLLVAGLGLPDWVFLATIVLLALGLPLAVATGLAERRRARQAGAAPERRLHQRLSWRTSMISGGAAFAMLGLAAALYTAMRLLGIGPVGTLLARGLLSSRDRLVLADFGNRTADTTLGLTVTEALRVDLTRMRAVDVLDETAVAGALRRMSHAPGTALDVALARDLAERLGAKAIVAGQVDPLGRGYVVAAQLVATDGRVLLAIRESAGDDAHLIAAVDRLSRALRERIGESLRAIRRAEPLEVVTTGSLEALRRYTAGVRASRAGDMEAAAWWLSQATTLDTGFGMAYRKLAAVLSNMDAPRAAVVGAATGAYRHRERLPEIEQYYASAMYFAQVLRDRRRAIEAYTRIVEQQPSELVAGANLGDQLLQARRWTEAERVSLQVAGAGGDWVAYGNALSAQLAQGRYAAAESTLARFAAREPRNAWVLADRCLIASTRRDYPAAETCNDSAARVEPAGSFAQRRALSRLVMLEGIQGKLAAATARQRQLFELAAIHGWPRIFLFGSLSLAWMDLRVRNAPGEAVRKIDEALRRYPLDSLAPDVRPYPQLAALYASAGRPDRARHLMQEFAAKVDEATRAGEPARLYAEAAIAVADRRYADAIVAYRAWCETLGGELCVTPDYEVARTRDAAGEPDSALAAYARAAATPGVNRLDADWLMLAATYRRLGELYEARGARAQAADAYRRLVELWHGADLELQPQVAAARAAVRRLAAGPGEPVG